MQKNFIIGGFVVLVVTGGIVFYLTRPTQPTIKRQSTQSAGNQQASPKEAPALAQQVAAGTLPSIDKRLPKTPVIVQPVERIGKYGGTWQMAMKSTGDHGTFIRTIGYENLVRWNTAWTGIVPNVALSYEVSPDVKEFTFRLREDMKWSDGEPFTADDIMFWYEDILSAKEFANQRPTWMIINGKLGKVVKMSDTAVKFTFDGPNGLLLKVLAQPRGAEPTSYPKHYLKQFVPKYNPNIAALIKSEGVKTWDELFVKKFGKVGTIDEVTRWQHPEVPTLNAWIITTKYENSASQKGEIVAERNPYYWKVDTAGSQLPYLDRATFQIVDDNNARLELAFAGKINMQDRHIGNSFLSSRETRTALAQHIADGNYHFFETVFASMNTTAISFNLNHNDPVMRKIFQDKNFRIGMSYAINRQQIVDKVMGGQGKPFQLAPRPESPLYNEKLATQYSEFDVTKANEYFDKAGLGKKDSEGYRLRPDGKRFTFTLDWGDKKTLEFLQQDWKNVGIDMKIGITDDRAKFYTRKNSNLHDAATWSGDGGVDVIEEPRYYFPYSNESNYAERWAMWFVNPQDPLAEEPPAAVKQQQELYRKIEATADFEEQQKIMKQILEIAADQFYAIGVSLPDKGYGIVRNNFHNVPAVMPSAFTFPNPAPTNPFQYFID